MDERVVSSIFAFYSLSTSSVSLFLSGDSQECLQLLPNVPCRDKTTPVENHALGGKQWDGSDYWLIRLYGIIADGRALPVGHHDLQGSPGGLQTHPIM